MPIDALLLGLGTGSYCVLSCAPLSLPLLFSEASGFKRNAGLVGLFLSGRLLGYLFVGLALGLSGFYALRYIDPRLEYWLSIVGYGLAGLVLLVQGLGYTGRFSHICALLRAKAVHRNALLLGLVSGLSICPPFVIAAGRVLVLTGQGGFGGAFLGVAYFAMFFLGTTVFFLPLLGVPAFAKWKDKLSTVSRISMILLGAYFLFFQCILEIIVQGVKIA